METVSLEDPISAVQAVMRDIDIPVVPIITLPQLQAYISSCSYGADVIESITAYRAKYGVLALVISCLCHAMQQATTHVVTFSLV